MPVPPSLEAVAYTRSTKRIVYRRPPLEESIFELRFYPAEPDPLVPGKLHSALGQYYPNAEALNNPVFPSCVSELQFPVVRFSNGERDLMLQYGPGLLSLVPSVQPYVGFSRFRPAVRRVLDAFVSIVPDFRVRRLGLRNVNLFSFTDPKVNVNDSFELAFQIPERLQDWSIELFSVTTVMEPPRSNRCVRMNLRSQALESELGIVLDLDCFQELELEFSEILPWLEESHDVLGDAFESSITQEARLKLGPK